MIREAPSRLTRRVVAKDQGPVPFYKGQVVHVENIQVKIDEVFILKMLKSRVHDNDDDYVAIRACEAFFFWCRSPRLSSSCRIEWILYRY